MTLPATLTVATLNTWKCDGAYWRRVPLMARAIAQAGPDIVFLQEVLNAPDADGADTSAALARATGLIAHDERARRTPRDVAGQWVESWSGMTILSRWPLDSRRLDLPVPEGRDWDRLAQVAAGETPFGRLTFVNIHLSHPPEDAPTRARQMGVVLNHLAARGGGPAIMGGDFNDTPDSPALRRLHGEARWRVDNAVAATGPFFPTFPETGQCVDHIVLLQSAAAPVLRCAGAGPLGDWSEDGIAPSDHVGVRAVFAGVA